MEPLKPGVTETVDLYLERIRANVGWLRRERAVNYEILAAAAGVSVATVVSTINGKYTPRTETLAAFAYVFGLEPGDWFLDHDTFKKKHAHTVTPPIFEDASRVKAAARSRARAKMGAKRTHLRSVSDQQERSADQALSD